MLARYRQLETNLNHLPGVQSADLAMYNPLTDNWGELIMVAGHPPGQTDTRSPVRRGIASAPTICRISAFP